MKTISEIIENIMILKGYKTEGEVAKALGMSLSALSNHKKNKTAPYKNILSFYENEGISLDALLTGEGVMRRGELKKDVRLSDEIGKPISEDQDMKEKIAFIRKCGDEADREDILIAKVGYDEQLNQIVKRIVARRGIEKKQTA